MSQLSQLKVTHWHSQAAYLRLLIVEILPKSIDRIIYLDSDLVVEGNLRQLWEAEVGDNLALAVQDFWNPYVSCPDALPETYEQLGISAHTPYFNTGVMVINLKQWRAQKIVPKVLAFTNQYHNLIRYADQDGINAAIAGRVGLLDPKWNVMVHIVDSFGWAFDLSDAKKQDQQDALLQAPWILHFTSPVKPWHPYYIGPAQTRFFYYLKRCGWFNPAHYLGRRIWYILIRYLVRFIKHLRKHLRAMMVTSC